MDTVNVGRKFFGIQEQNEWEGETWRNCYPYPGNEDIAKYLENFLKKTQELSEAESEEDFPFSYFEIMEYELDVLINWDDSGNYKPAWNKFDKTLDFKKITTKLDRLSLEKVMDYFYKGPEF